MISIIIPVYNTEKYLATCLDSVLVQTYKDFEVILIDDGSTDNSLLICKEYAEKNARISLITQKNKGVALARARGLEVAKGEYVAFIDSDDYIEVNMYELLLDRLEKTGADVANCRFAKEYPDGRIEYSSDIKSEIILNRIEALESLHYGEDIGASLANKLIRKELLNQDDFQKGVTIGEDYRVTCALLLQSSKIISMPNVLYHYMQRQDSACYTGYTGNGDALLSNYQTMRDAVTSKYPELKLATVSFCTLQEMSIVISMVKANRYDSVIIKKVQKSIRENIWEYLRIRKVPFYLKGCALLLSVHASLLIFPYQLIFKKRRSVN